MVEFTPRCWVEVKEKDEEEYVVPDIIFTGNNFRLAIDVSGVHGESPSYLPSRIDPSWSVSDICCSEVVRNREAKKTRHYADLPRSGECEFIPFVFESHGGLGEAANRVITKLAAYGAEQNGCSDMVMAGYIRRLVAIAIQRGNAGLDSVARQKQAGSYGGMVGKGLIAVGLDGGV